MKIYLNSIEFSIKARSTENQEVFDQTITTLKGKTSNRFAFIEACQKILEKKDQK